jgi:UMF1 family MFS transporter
VKESTKNGLLYGTYDFSNSGYVLIFQSFLFPVFFTSVVGNSLDNPDALWGWLIAISTGLSILISPFLGKYADFRGRAKVFSILVLSCGLIVTLSPFAFLGKYAALALIFVFFNTLFELSQTIYDSFLKDLTSKTETTTTLSTIAWGFGYIGGVLFAAIYLVMDRLKLDQRTSLMIFGLLYLVLSVPAIIFFRTINIKKADPRVSKNNSILKPSPPVLWRHLVIYWVIADCVAAIMYFAPLFVNRELGIGTRAIGALLLATQLLAFPLTMLSGKVANRVGPLKTIRLALIIWIIALLGLFFAKSVVHVAAIMIPIAFVIGSTQAILRAHYAMNVAQHSAGEGFGFYAIAQKSAAVLSPALIALIITLTGKIRLAFIVLAFLLLVTFFLVNKLPTPVLSENS